MRNIGEIRKHVGRKMADGVPCLSITRIGYHLGEKSAENERKSAENRQNL